MSNEAINTDGLSPYIDEILDETENAYSREIFGEEHWEAMSETLASVFDDKQAIWFLMSKHTRWLGDSIGGSVELGKADSKALEKSLIEYIGRNKNGLWNDIDAGCPLSIDVEELIESSELFDDLDEPNEPKWSL